MTRAKDTAIVKCCFSYGSDLRILADKRKALNSMVRVSNSTESELAKAR